MAIRIACPSCQTAYTVDERNAGRKSKCAKCGQHFQVPAVPGETSATADPSIQADAMPPLPKPAAGPVDDSVRSLDDRDEEERPPRRRRRVRRSQAEDDYEDDYESNPPRRPGKPGQGLAIASMILGIGGIIVTIVSAGPVLFSMCCMAFTPISWVVSGIGGVAGLVAVILGVVSRSMGNRTAFSTSGIVMGAIAIVFATVGVVLTLVVPAAVLMNPPTPAVQQPQPNWQPQPGPPIVAKPGIRQPPVIKAPASRTSKILGGGGDPEFEDTGPPGSLLVGLEIGLGKFFNNDVVRAMRPIFRKEDNDEFGAQRGTQLNRVIEVVAKPGYAIGAVTIKAGLTVDGMSVTFMRVRGDKLNPTDSYESEWIGGLGGGGPQKLGGDGTPVVGIVCKVNAKDATGLGLVFRR